MVDKRAGPVPPTSGIFITKGMRIGIPHGGLTFSIGEDGKADGHLVLHASLDVTPHWFGIALEHLAVAERAHSRLAAAWQGQDNNEITQVLEAEFAASMQAMMAAAIAIDAFYAAIKDYIIIPPSMLQAWRDNGTARHKQVYETLKRGFTIGTPALSEVRKALSEIYKFRDLAVHPDPTLAETPTHPDLTGVGTEWRFIYFRYEIAKPVVNAALSLVIQLLGVPKDKNKALGQYATATTPMMAPHKEEWESRYGPLYPGAQPSGSAATADARSATRFKGHLS